MDTMDTIDIAKPAPVAPAPVVIPEPYVCAEEATVILTVKNDFGPDSEEAYTMNAGSVIDQATVDRMTNLQKLLDSGVVTPTK